MCENVVIKAAVNCLVHVPELVMHGSKPRREIKKDNQTIDQLQQHLRSFKKAVSYPPNQTFIGGISPKELRNIKRPWYNYTKQRPETGKFGKIIEQHKFYDLLKQADVLNFFDTEKKNKTSDNLPIFDGYNLVGYMNRDNRAEGIGDENLEAHHILENLCAKASGAVAMESLFKQTDLRPEKVDYILSCGEEAGGDRYQRGGGGMAKAIGHMCGCLNASGIDIKNFCAAPASAIILAGALVKAGLFKNVVVVGGGSLAKLGMKFQSFTKNNMPILDDCLGSIACLISRDDGTSPIIRLEEGAIGVHPVSAGPIDSIVYEYVIARPLKNLDLKINKKIRYSPELQNEEIMEHAGAGDVARKNFRKIADQAVEELIANNEIDEDDEDAIDAFMDAFTEKISVPGFAPTQGHIPSAVPLLPLTIEDIKKGDNERTMFVGKASLFLNRVIESYDAVSFILEKNPAQR